MAAKIDYVSALKLAGETDPEKASGLLRLVDQLNKLSGWFAFLGIDVKAELKKLVAKYVTDRKKADKTAPPPAVVPDDSAPVPSVPAVPATAPTAPGARRITSIVGPSYTLLAQENKVVGKAHFDAVMSREDPTVGGDRVFLNASPFDQFGKEIASDGQEGVDRPGFTGKNWTPELDAAMWYPDRSSRLRWFVEGGIGRITGGTHQRGFTPKVKHDKGTLADNQEAELGSVYGIYTAPDGSTIRTSTLPSLRAKG